MPEQETVERAERDKEQGKSPSTQAGEFVREEMHHVREGKHGARSTKQAIAIGLSKARRSGVKLRPPKRRAASARTRRQAARETARARKGGVRKVSRKRATAMRGARSGETATSPTHTLFKGAVRTMVKIRLRRVGRKNAPFYRILVADSQSPRDGKFIEIIGQYAPRKSEGSLQVDEARANYWLDLGAQPTDTVRLLPRRAGVLRERHEEG